MTNASVAAMERGLPANTECERAILGAILLSPDAYISAISNGLTPDDMSLDSNRRILAQMILMGESGRHIDSLTLREELTQARQLEAVGGVSYIASLTDGIPYRSDVRSYVRTVREKAKLRKLIHGFNAGIGDAMGGVSSQNCIDRTGELLLQVQTESADAPAERIIKFSDEVYSEWKRIAHSESELIGRTTGIGSLDLTTTGIREGEFWIIGGRTGDGKSSLALQIAAANLRQEIPVGVFSVEMSKGEIAQRLWSHHGRIPFQQIRNPRGISSETRARVKRAMAEVGAWPLFVNDGSLSIQRLLAKARLLIRQERVKLLIVDYLQIVTATAKDERERLTRVSNALRDLAKSEGVPVLGISQLNRAREGNLNARPNKLSLKESGSLENDAHTIVLTYRPVDGADQPSGDDLLIVAKQRHGPVSLEPVYFDSKTLGFYERTACSQEGNHK